MKTYIHYDAEGVIRSLVSVNAPKGAGMVLAPKPGVLVAEVEGIEIKPSSGGLSDMETLREIAKAHVVAAPLPKAALKKKR